VSTRGMIAFRVGGVVRAAHNHCDSYPEGLGVQVLRFARQMVKDDAVAVTSLRALALAPVTGQPDADQIKALIAWADLSRVDPKQGITWSDLLRRTEGNPDAILTAGYIIDASAELNTRWVAWAYELDFDAEALRVYRHGDEIMRFTFAALPDDDVFLSRLNG